MIIILPTILINVFLFVGLYLILNTIISTTKQKQRCTYKITATVIDILTKNAPEGEILYSPLYKYVYLDKEYTVSENIYQSSKLLKIGNTVDIFTNEKIDEIYIKHTLSTIFIIIIGALFVVVSIFSSYIFLL